MKTRLRISKGTLSWFAIIVAAALLLGISTALAVSPPGGALPSDGSPTPAATPHLGGPQLNFPEAKATARANPGPRPPRGYNPPPHKSDPTPISGIIETHQGPWSAMDFRVNNAWSGQVGPDWLVVYAGGKRGPQPEGKIEQGGLRINVRLTDAHGAQSFKSIGEFLAPAGPDPLTITAVDGVIMRLRTDSGKALSFNLQTRQYQ